MKVAKLFHSGCCGAPPQLCEKMAKKVIAISPIEASSVWRENSEGAISSKTSDRRLPDHYRNKGF
jgi:hypothetical protein